MYKNASDLAQSRNGRQVVVDAMVAGGRAETQTAADQLANLQRVAHGLNMQMASMPKAAAGRAALVTRKLEIEGQIRELKRKVKGAQIADGSRFQSILVDVLKERTAPALWKIYVAEATSRYEAERIALEASAPATDPDVAA